MRKKSVLALLALSTLTLSAEAKETREYRVKLAPGEKPTPILVEKVAPSFGELVAVRIEMHADVQGKLHLENLARVNQTAFAQVSYGTALHGLDGQIVLFSSGESSRVQRMPSFDGALDFGGDSARSFAFEEEGLISAIELNESNFDLSALVNREGEVTPFELNAEMVAHENLVGVSNVASQLQAQAELTVRISFLFLHPIDDEPVVVPTDHGDDRIEANEDANRVESQVGIVQPAALTADEPRRNELNK